MSANSLNRSVLFCFLSAIILTYGGVESEAQETAKSLFVIKTPKVDKSSYGEKANAFRFAKLAAQQEEPPKKDIGSGSSEENRLESLNKRLEMGSGDENSNVFVEDDLKDDDFDDLEDSRPARTMTTWNLKPMSSITAGIRPVAGNSPEDQSWQLTKRGTMPSTNTHKLFAWAAPDIKYNPLYFEDVTLERYGQTRGLFRQPFVSGIHFLKSAAFLPYHTLYDPINSCDGPLGYCRPGVHVNCTSQKHYFGNPFQSRR